MFRSGVIVAVVCILLADPILCRTGLSTVRTSEILRLAGTSAPIETPAPVDPSDEALHGCVCQGATASLLIKTPDQMTSLDDAIPSPGWISMELTVLVGHFPPPPPRPNAPVSGRSIRIVRQSFLT